MYIVQQPKPQTSSVLQKTAQTRTAATPSIPFLVPVGNQPAAELNGDVVAAAAVVAAAVAVAAADGDGDERDDRLPDDGSPPRTRHRQSSECCHQTRSDDQICAA